MRLKINNMSKLEHYTKQDIKDLEKIFRANLINSVTGYKPANLIGTYSESGIANLALFSSVIHLGAEPPLVGYIQRPVGEFGHTYKNIKNTGFYTINQVQEEFAKNAHYTSAKFDERTSEFDACGLTKELLPGFEAPFVKESQIKIGVRFIQEMPIELNNTILVIGKIEHVLLDKDVISPGGDIDLSKVNVVCTSGLQAYNRVTRFRVFPYARVKDLPEF
jgi:flavin reductase (DIM6/NTAB) family NADH-FMN oxidoreductase RutF